MPGKTKAKRNRTRAPVQNTPRKRQTAKRAEIEKLLKEAAAARQAPHQVKAKHHLKPTDTRVAVVDIKDLYRNPLPFKFPIVDDPNPLSLQTASEVGCDGPPGVVKFPPVTTYKLSPKLRIPSLGFLDFPGEVRNQIYHYLFRPDLYEIDFCTAKDKALTFKLPRHPFDNPKFSNTLLRERRRSLDYHRRLRSDQHWLDIDPARQAIGFTTGPCAIFLTCKIIAFEAPSIFYSTSIFSFKHNRPMKEFFDTVPQSSIRHIRSLNLQHHTAGDPLNNQYTLWKLKYDHSWESLCENVSEKLHSLENLSIDFTIYDDPFDTDEEAEWKWSIYAFREMDIKRCRIRLRNVMVDDDILRVEEFKLQQAILGEGFTFEQDEKEKSKRKAWLKVLDEK